MNYVCAMCSCANDFLIAHGGYCNGSMTTAMDATRVAIPILPIKPTG